MCAAASAAAAAASPGGSFELGKGGADPHVALLRCNDEWRAVLARRRSHVDRLSGGQ